MKESIGESKSFTAKDIQKIRMLYNYIVKKKLLQAPDCHKLFEPGKKFNLYKPSNDNLEPRPKPYKYTDAFPESPLEINKEEENDPSLNPNEDENLVENTEEEPNTDVGSQLSSGINSNEINSQSDNILNENENDDVNGVGNSNEEQSTNDNNNGNWNKGLPKQFDKEDDESENLSSSNVPKISKTPVIITIGKNKNAPILLKSPFKPPAPDLLADLSDYNWDQN